MVEDIEEEGKEDGDKEGGGSVRPSGSTDCLWIEKRQIRYIKKNGSL